MGFKISNCLFDRVILLITQLIGNDSIRTTITRNNSMVLRKVYKVSTSYIRIDLKPLGSFFAGNPQLLQICMEIFVCKSAIRFCQVCGTKVPPCLMVYANRVCLLVNSSFNISFCKANFCPTVMLWYSWSGVGVTLRSDFCGCVYLYSSHYAISLINELM